MKITQGFDGLVDSLDGHPRKQLVHIFLGICPAIKKDNLTQERSSKTFSRQFMVMLVSQGNLLVQVNLNAFPCPCDKIAVT